MRLIAFDTAGPVIGVAALVGTRTAARSLRVARGTEGVLPELVVAVLDELGATIADLDGVVVAGGPGAFTGLRVGISAATALATARSVPVVVVDSLLPRALAAGFGPTPLLVWLDARKGRVYTSGWAVDGTRTSEPADVAPDEVLAGWTGPLRATGEGALVYRAAIERAGGVVVGGAADPGVSELVREGGRRLAAGGGCDAAEVVPLYVREPDVGGTAAV